MVTEPSIDQNAVRWGEMVRQEKAKLIANVPRHILEMADEIAAKRRMSRTSLVVECLSEMIAQRERDLLAEGYRAMAEENKKFAELVEPVARELFSKE